MNSEELELSLRTEFESHLKNVVADMRQEFSRFQETVEAEFDKHKSQIDAAFQEFSAKFDSNRPLEASLSEMVVEHLRLARDEGARISATAFAEAEKLEKETAAAAPQAAGINELSAGINEIAAQDSQATILKSLVHHAAEFTPRGAFFIIKNEHFVGWRVFGKEGDADEQAVREVFLPVASSTVLGESVRSLSAVESSYGTYDDDSIYLNKLGFGQPSRMIAIPLVARGRGVAVLYADFGTQGEDVNVEALETLVRVAGLTVEVLAAAPAARAVQEDVSVPDEVYAAKESREEFAQPVPEQTEEVAPPEAEELQAAPEAVEEPAMQETTESEEFSSQPISVSESDIVEEETQEFSAPEETPEMETAPAIEEETAEPEAVSVQAEEPTVEETVSWSEPEVAVEEQEEFQSPVADTDYTATEPTSDYQFTQTPQVEETPAEIVETPQVETPSFEPVQETSFRSQPETAPVAETPAPTVSAPTPTAPTPTVSAKPRFGDRNVDLPIEVSDDERRLHNDARRFARLLVSEIKLYNEQKVKEGREAQDLYERLREAIDRSRDMYDKRVQPPVAAKFDYFHYELVNSLAEGEEAKLGTNYPGAEV